MNRALGMAGLVLVWLWMGGLPGGLDGSRDASRDALELASPHGPSARFDRGARLMLGGHQVTLALAAIGRGEAIPIAPGTPHMAEGEVRIERGLITEWWRALPSGLEHGVTLAKRPAGNGELRLSLSLDGDLHARSRSDDAVDLVDARGRRVATYAHLAVVDADGRRVPARMSGGREITIAVQDDGHRYPLVVDPIVTAEIATLDAPIPTVLEQLGIAVAVSADGTRALVAGDGGRPGTAHVFVAGVTGWVWEAQLVAPDVETLDGFGAAVALSADGSVALVGAPLDDVGAVTDVGSARVFTRSGATWTYEAALVGTGAAANDFAAGSVSLSGDGTRAFVGVRFANTARGANAGAAFVFVRGGAGWAFEAMLTAADGATGESLGFSIAASGDGLRAVVGAIGDDLPGSTDAGSARVFARTGTTWALEATLVAPDAAANDELGFAVSIDGDGSRVVVGAHNDDTTRGVDAGTGHVFSRVGLTWAHEAALAVSDAAGDDQWGQAVRISSDGRRALVAAPSSDLSAGIDVGRVGVFLRDGSGWTLESTLSAADGEAFDYFGASLALSADGAVVIVGVPGDAGSVGSARVFSLTLAPDGTPCSGDSVCASGFCTDGVCCEARCGGGGGDCRACAAALTGVADGTCAVLSAGTECRAAAGSCDVAEVCSGAAACPADVFAPAGGVCRAAVTVCDAAEACSGTSAACPSDEVAAAGTVCRAEAGACDSIEVCDGATTICPGDAFEPMGNVCGTETTDCALPAICTGMSASCPSVGVRPSGTVCRPASGRCDIEDRCDGTSELCADAFEPATTSCGMPAAGVCDAPDHCSGTSADCEAVFLVGVACRAAAGSCDAPEICGAAPDCPTDAVVSAGLSCRASIDPSCDPEEVCDGASITCPSDTTTCDPPADGAIGADAGTTPPVAACACRATRRQGGGWLVSLVVLALVHRRRRASAETGSASEAA